MVLIPEIENKILRIEKEYLARERLANHGLKPRKKFYCMDLRDVVKVWLLNE